LLKPQYLPIARRRVPEVVKPNQTKVTAFARPKASSAPAPPESSDRTIMSAGATGSLTTSAQPAPLRTGSRRERTATIANADNATAPRIAHLGRREIILGFIGSLHESAMSFAAEHRPAPPRCLVPCWPISEVVARLIEVRSVGRSGLDLLTLSSSHLDPTRNSHSPLVP